MYMVGKLCRVCIHKRKRWITCKLSIAQVKQFRCKYYAGDGKNEPMSYTQSYAR